MSYRETEAGGARRTRKRGRAKAIVSGRELAVFTYAQFIMAVVEGRRGGRVKASRRKTAAR